MAIGSITLSSIVEARAGRGPDVQQALLSLIRSSRGEKGCLNYDLHQDPEDAHRFMFYENWGSEAAFQAHLKTPHIAAFMARWDDLLAAPIAMQRWTMLSSVQKEAASS